MSSEPPSPAARPRVVLVCIALLLLVQSLHAGAVAGAFGAVDEEVRRWTYEVIIAAAAGLTLWRVRVVEADRRAWAAIGASMVIYLLADLYYTVWLYGDPDPPYPSPGDALYLLNYVPLYYGLLLLIRKASGRVTPSMVLEGLTAAFASGSLVAAIVLRPDVLVMNGGTAAVVTTISYPVLDVILLTLVGGGLVVQRGRPDRPFTLLAIALVITTVIDGIYAARIADGTWVDGGVVDLGWPVSLTLVMLAAWARPRSSLSPAPGARHQAVPAAFSLLALGLLVWTLIDPIAPAARVLLGAAVVSLLGLQFVVGRERRALIAERTQDRVAREVAQARSDRDEALEASKLKSAFLANMSHEIRSPLNGVIGMTELLQATDLDRRQRQFADAARSSGEALLGIVDDILDLSKIEAGMFALEQETFLLVTTVEKAVAAVRADVDKKHLTVALTVGAEVPPAVIGDGNRVRQIAINLLTNAVKFTPSGRIDVHVACVGTDGESVRLRTSVTDTGIGLAPATLDEMFEPFNQADVTTTRLYGGTGLGLTICRQLVELMGGRVGASSVLDRGSTFWFEIPFTRSSAPAEAAPPALPRATRTGSVLVVEDGAVNQLVARHMLEHLGYAVTLAEDGFEALDALHEAAFDAVLMDCQMPQMDGYATTRELRARERPGQRVPVIAVTANAMAGDRERCLAAGMDDYLSKPLRPQLLADVLRRWTGDGGAPAPQAQPAPATDTVLDPVMIDDLRSLGDTDFAQMIDLYLVDTDRLVATLQAAIRAGDAAELAATAHKLKGSSLGFGARAVATCATTLDRLAKAGELTAAGAALTELEAAVERTRGALRREAAGV